MKDILKKIEETTPTILHNEYIRINCCVGKYEIEINCNFKTGDHFIELYYKKSGDTINIPDKYFNNIVDFCKSIVTKDMQEKRNCFTSDDYRHFNSLIN